MNFLIHTIDRKNLVEGRTSGIVMGLAEKTSFNDNTTYILKTGLSGCKDYLNDVVAVERSGFKPKEVYRFNYKKNQFTINTRNYLVFRSESYQYIIKESDCTSFAFKHDRLYHLSQELSYQDNLVNALFVLNRIEKEIFNFKDNELTKGERIDEYVTNDGKFLQNPLIVFDFHKKWLRNQINMSLFAGLCRRSIVIKEFTEEELELPILEFIKSLYNKRNLNEGFGLDCFEKLTKEELNLLFNNNLPHLKKLLNNRYLDTGVHSFGIESFMQKVKWNKQHTFETLQIKLPEETTELIKETANEGILSASYDDTGI